MNSDSRILIVSSIDVSLLRFRGRLIELLSMQGFVVFVAAPSFCPDIEKKLRQLGAETLEIPMSRSGLSVLKDWTTYRSIKKVMREMRIDLVFPYTIKPVMYSSLAARQLGTPVVGLVNGLGYLYTGNSAFQRILRRVIVPVYCYCVAENKAMIFQNADDLDYYCSEGLLGRGTYTCVVPGSGVDLCEFSWRNPREGTNLRFCFVGRLLVEKGIQLFVEVATQIKRKWPDAEFHVYGEPQGESSNSVRIEDLQSAIDGGIIHYHGRVSDIASELQNMDVIVCPSWYREGVPRSLLEALSVGLAIIATDTPGCRETINHGVNGWLIQPRDLDQLLAAVCDAIESPMDISKMSYESRKMAETVFDVKLVNDEILEVFRQSIGEIQIEKVA